MNFKRFFPKSTFNKNEGLDTFTQKWYGKHLLVMNEKPIYNSGSSDLTIYRLLYLRTFEHPVMIKITIEKNEILLRAIILSGAGGYEPGTVKTDIKRTLSEKDVQEIEKLIENMDFWNLNTNKERLGLDGNQCIFEVYDKTNKYHVIDRWSPEFYKDDKEYVDLINHLLNLANINVPELYDPRR
ncbi:MAG: hypothetical protein GF364_00740 [Candidatus Lokiarchaeota archaeon]|nr:hypothetical protein [Candidatus Lokiarchaeota archaeon]